NSLPTNSADSCFVSTHVNFARRPPAIISRANSSVGHPHTGNNGSRPVPCNCAMRYARMSSRKRSPKAIASIPWLSARSQASFMRDSYISFVQGQGSGMTQSGRSAACACASSTERRVPCIATRSNSAFNVVRRPTISTSACWRRTWRLHALSLPLLQESNTRFIETMLPQYLVLALHHPGSVFTSNDMLEVDVVRYASEERNAFTYQHGHTR